ncbi:MAG TPA: hypothetical protein VFP34_11315 [Microlunatus sp.]|nr:hypothetical protein [Microlunatus sp.]
MIGTLRMRIITALLAGGALAGGLTLPANALPTSWYVITYYSDATQTTAVGGNAGGCIQHRSWGQTTPYFSEISGACGRPN